MKRIIIVFIAGFFSIGAAALLNFSEEAGLFGAIIAIGSYLASEIDAQKEKK